MFTEYIYNQLLQIYKTIGVSKRFDPKEDVVLVLGGSTTPFGQILCQVLVHKYKTKVVNFDRYDDPNCHCPGLYHFIRCDFTQRKSVHNAFFRAKLLGLSCTVLINNVNELLDGITGEDPLKNCRDIINANLINVMIATKLFITQIVPPEKDVYIVNVTSTPGSDESNEEISTYYHLAQAGLVQFHDGMSSELNLKEINHGYSYKPLLIYIPINKEKKAEKLVNDFIKVILEGRQGIEYLYVGMMQNSTILQMVEYYKKVYSHCGQW
ncbi:similar to Saccharomyces cerevisiae YPL033C SRL4 Protein of unknown function [Maudiozyma barnettii]|uniref:Uncharacterized protein n=1 Tax=Maudiozyma barnettii TaxID=61262 RepID=A0A8H2VJZ1_9SACH|nr:Srl4p [Kazachstania barnettii]CAB4257089.1 similar to Saccharomyces cerevisiae YPL033C SRL4 Protein of unknown function [Kazachstania barnettii]CAD1779460.1 similar to Saccharomyces cerevisiae YPL033C SRL4 Protein of unknown function [Kazachstania barnettii]